MLGMTEQLILLYYLFTDSEAFEYYIITKEGGGLLKRLQNITEGGSKDF